jgi:hypothetical protein
METGVFKISVVFLSVRFVENSTVESYDLSCAQTLLAASWLFELLEVYLASL